MRVPSGTRTPFSKNIKTLVPPQDKGLFRYFICFRICAICALV